MTSASLPRQETRQPCLPGVDPPGGSSAGGSAAWTDHPQLAGSPVRPVLWSVYKHWDDEEDEAAICRYCGRDYNP